MTRQVLVSALLLSLGFSHASMASAELCPMAPPAAMISSVMACCHTEACRDCRMDSSSSPLAADKALTESSIQVFPVSLTPLFKSTPVLKTQTLAEKDHDPVSSDSSQKLYDLHSDYRI